MHFSGGLQAETNAMQLAVGLLSIMCFFGFLCTLLVPETSGLSLEDIVAKYHDWEENSLGQPDKAAGKAEEGTGGQGAVDLQVGPGVPPAADLPSNPLQPVGDKPVAGLNAC